MKKSFIILLILTLTASLKNSNAQTTGVSDTLAYVQTIVNNKEEFVGKPFSVLMDSLKIQIKHFWPNRSIVYDITKEPSTQFSFYFPQSADEAYLTYPCLEIYWQTPLNASQSDVLWKSNNGGGWSSAVAVFYASAIISDIKIRE